MKFKDLNEYTKSCLKPLHKLVRGKYYHLGELARVLPDGNVFSYINEHSFHYSVKGKYFIAIERVKR
jgi:hypothetical protein